MKRGPKESPVLPSTDLPWCIRVYLLVLVLFVGLVLISAVHDPMEQLWVLASDGVKTTLGALLGTLSLLAESRLRSGN